MGMGMSTLLKVGGVAVVFRLLCKRYCTICEKRDTWKITDEIRDGERAAGSLYKRGKGAAVWSKRYFAITDTKMIYYTGRDRTQKKGEIVLAGATAAASTTRANQRKKYYFSVSHPKCGTRELYAKSKVRRDQWIERINDVSNELLSMAVYGKLFKQGGMSKSSWQERWCICAGTNLDYFDQPTDNQSKGFITLTGATFREFQQKDKHCIEISVAAPGKKGLKKYVFAVDKEHELQKWVEAFRRAASASRLGEDESETVNPIRTSSDGTGEREDDSGLSMTSFVGRDTAANNKDFPSEYKSYLFKMSPALLKGWQKRYFVVDANGLITYYKSEEDAGKNKESKGVINIKDIQWDGGVTLDSTTLQINLKLEDKEIKLKALNLEEAEDWVANIEAWMNTLQS